MAASSSYQGQVRLTPECAFDQFDVQFRLIPLHSNLADAGLQLSHSKSDFPDFNDPNKLGEGNSMVERLSNLVAIFQKPELDFSKNRADNDDILGDAYEYLMRHFATESGKGKGYFYTRSSP